MAPEPLPSLAVVMPAWNAAGQLERSLPPLVAEAGSGPVIVVDAGSTDETRIVAARLGAQVVVLPERAGPARARNAGVQDCAQELILFVDADCVVEPGVVAAVRRAFAANPLLVSLTGSYDDDPADRGFFSLYMNLRHHAVHQGARRDSATFWAGLGAVRKAAFELAGGFDERRYPRPMIEDIELARRLRPLGEMQLDPALRVKHLKRWSLASVVRTDVLSRAVPWTKLILEDGQAPKDLNLKMSQRVAAAFSPFVLAATLALPWIALTRPLMLLPALAVMGVGFALNAPMLRTFARKVSWAFAIPAILFHQVHLTYSALTFVCVKLTTRKGPSPAEPNR